MALTLIQSLRRLSQGSSGWRNTFVTQDSQVELLQKLYAANGLELKMTCPACPEQYDVFKDGQQVAYFRLRHGEFSVDYPSCNKETIYEAEPNGDGCFDSDERLVYLTRAMRVLLTKLAA